VAARKEPHAGEALSHYEVEYAPCTGGLLAVMCPIIFETSQAPSQQRLFRLDSLGEAGWLKALGLDEYAPRRPWRQSALQQVLFVYTEAI
jgi:hypothetical protein